MLHLKGFIPSWTDRICLFKSGFKAKRSMWRASFLDKKLIKVRIRTNNWDEETYRNKLKKVVSQTTDIIKTSNFGSLLMCFIGWKIVAIVKGGFFIQLSLADRFFPAYYAHCVLVHSSTVQLVSNSLKKDLIFLIFPVGVLIPMLFFPIWILIVVVNVLDLKNLQEQVKKAFCFKNCTDLSLFE